ncbi:hypothetical protein BpHYR1_017510, partial [Brachionus plicatilis]
EVDDTSQHVIDSIESTINRVNLDQNLDKTKKNWSCLDKAKEWRKCITKKKINFNERSEPTSYATRNIDNTKILAFMMNFDIVNLTPPVFRGIKNIGLLSVKVLVEIKQYETKKKFRHQLTNLVTKLTKQIAKFFRS